jgi:hypothetical protein
MKRPQWIALYTDGSVLTQYKEDGTEWLFSEIEHSKLFRFVLDVAEGKTFCVDLQDGSFFIGPQQFAWDGFGVGSSYRLIYFRRVRQVMGMGTTTPSTEVIFHLGWQTTLNNQNHQRVMAISADGSASILTK